jgi:DNA-dependent RNA polymerase auxiliary subunit epsilon
MSQQLPIGVLQSRRDARIKELARLGPLLQGSLCEIHVTCGNPNCRCARGDKHPAYQVTKKVRGTTKTLYIPVDLVEEVRTWVREHRRAKQLLKEISALSEKIIRARVPTRRARQRHQAAVAAAGPPPTR